MHPLDALNPKISDEELVISYGCVITDLVTDNHTVSDVIRNDRIESHKWFTDLLLLIFEGYEEPLANWDLAPKKIRGLQEEVKRLREEVSSVIREMLSDSEEDPSWGATVHAYIKDLQKVIE